MNAAENRAWQEHLSEPRYCSKCNRPLIVEHAGEAEHPVVGRHTYRFYRECACPKVKKC